MDVTDSMTNHYTIRHAQLQDAPQLSSIRPIIDGETEFMDREKGEAFMTSEGFRTIIQTDEETPNHLFLVAETNDEIVGFSRCEGSPLKRSAHKVEFGVCLLKAHWGNGIGRRLLEQSLQWADAQQIRKVTLTVLADNHKAIKLYEQSGFKTEGILVDDKRLSDGTYHDTLIMGRIQTPQ
jgi:RimJ/RimL family protein N-acetyltransferase